MTEASEQGPTSPSGAAWVGERPPIHAVTLAALLHALSDPVRLAIVQRLIEAEACNCRNAGGPDVPKASLSRHFKVLRAAGVVESWQDAGGGMRNRVRTADLEARFPGLLTSVLAALAGED